MKGNFKATSALTLLSTTTVDAKQDAALENLKAAIAKEFALIPQREMTNAVSAVLIGAGLHVVKHSLPRGEFRPYIEEMLPAGNKWSKATSIKNASYFMRLAIAAFEEIKPSKQEMLTLTNGVSSEAVETTGPAAKLIGKIEKWIGERSLNEILADEGIKDGGSGGGGGKSAGAITAGEDPLWADTASHLMGLREVLLDPESVKRFTATQLDDIEKQWASGLDQFRQLRASMRSN